MNDSLLNADAIVVGAGLAGLVATAELAAAGKSVALLDQEPEASLGGQAFWSLGGLFFVDSPEQRRARIHDSFELAWSDWLGSAQFDRPEDEHPQRFARAYVEFATVEKRDWLRSLGVRVLPSPGWAERGGGHALAHGNSVPRFHLTWGTGPPSSSRSNAASARPLGAGSSSLPFGTASTSCWSRTVASSVWQALCSPVRSSAAVRRAPGRRSAASRCAPGLC